MEYRDGLKEQFNELMHEIIFANRKIDKKQLNFVRLCERDITIISMIAHQDKITAKEISERLNIPKTTIVTAVKRLVDRGYVLQIRNNADKRENILKLSDKGIMINSQHLAYEDTILEFLISKWTKEQQEQLYYLIKNRRK